MSSGDGPAPSVPPRLRLHGPPQLIAPAGASALERKDAALLALLALDGPAPRDRLAAWLWPEAALSTARGNLRQRVFRLRQRCGHPLLQHEARLSLDPEVQLEPADESAGELLAGLAFEDCPAIADWLLRQRERQAWARREALAAASTAHEAAGELARALELAGRLWADDPLSEHAARRVIRLHYLRGDRAAAIAAFERLERQLRDELGTRPDRESLELLALVERGGGPAVGLRRPVPASLQRPPQLVGRAPLLNAMQSAWEAGRLLHLVGEAGMGKSRLLQAFAAQQGPGRVLRVQARPGDAGVPYALLARLLKAATGQEAAGLVLPEAGSAPTADADVHPLRLQRAAEQALAAAAGVQGLLIDDLQFADPASLDLLQALCAAESLAALRWGLAQRPAEADAPVTGFVDGLVGTQRLVPLALPPLEAPALHELLQSLALPGLDTAALVPALQRHTGGNPLFVLETLKDLVLQATPPAALPVPAPVGRLIEARLRRLSSPALLLARVAALAGVEFSIALAEQVLQTPALVLADAWQELEEAQVLADGGFAHDLVQDAVLRGVPPAIARHVRGAIARQLQRTGAAPARIAEHAAAAGDHALAARAGAEAARLAQAGARLREALQFWRQAAEAHGRAGEPEPAFECLLQAETAALAVLQDDELRAWGDALVAQAQGPLQRQRALVASARAHNQPRDGERAAVLATEALALARTLGDRAGALRAARQQALAGMHLGRPAEALARFEAEGLLDGLALLDPQEQAGTWIDYAWVLAYADQRERSLRESDAAIALARRGPYPVDLSTALSNSAVTCAMLGRMHEALQRHRDGMQLLEDRPVDALSRAIDETTLGALLTEIGALGEALPWLERAWQAGRTRPREYWSMLAAGNLAYLWLLLGQPARAHGLMADAFDDAAPVLRGATLRLRLMRALGQDGAAQAARVQQALQAPDGAPILPSGRLGLEIELAQWQPADEATRRLAAIEAEARGRELVALAQAAAGLRIGSLLEIGEQAAAARVARAFLAALPTAQPYDTYLPRLWWQAARALHAAGDAAAAREVLGTAVAWVERAAAGLPDALREAFRRRNAVNQALLAAAGQDGDGRRLERAMGIEPTS